MSSSENREAALIAEIASGTTHEIRNILAIVKESAGLIDDLIYSFDRRGSLDQDKVKRSIGRIEAQVARGAALLSNLSRLAHSLDEVEDTLELNQEVEQVAFLCQHRARRKRQVLTVQPAGQSPTLTVNPFQFQMTLFTAVECCIEQLPQGSTLVISTERENDRSIVEFTGEAGDQAMPSTPTEATGWSRLLELVDDLGASLEVTRSACGFRLSLPVTRAA